jgi:hypothetical protein
MNIRFADRHIRFRVGSHELERLLSGRSLTLDVPMPRSHQFRASIGVSSLPGWQLDSDPTGLWLTLPRMALEELLQQLPSKDGLEHEFQIDGSTLRVSFEVDLRNQGQKRAA